MGRLRHLFSVSIEIRAVIAVLTISLLTGCASIDPGPFQTFNASISAAQAGSEEFITTDVGNAKNRFESKVLSGDIPPFELQLHLVSSDSMPPFAMQYGFANSDDEPLYFKLVRFQEAFNSLNQALKGYSAALLNLASGMSVAGSEDVDQSRFDRLTRDLNASALGAAQLLGLGSDSENPGEGGRELALITTAAVRIFQAVIEKQRRQDLVRAIREVQPQIVMFTEAAQDAVKLLGTGVAVDYDDQIGPLINRPPPATPETLQAILDLNEKTQETMASLDSLYKVYGGLPEAHAALTQVVNKQPSATEALLDFADETLRLSALQDELVTSNQNQLAGN